MSITYNKEEQYVLDAVHNFNEIRMIDDGIQ